MDINKRISDLLIVIPEAPKKGGVYSPVKEFGGKFAYVSGCGPAINGVLKYRGRLGADLTLEQGQEAARDCILNILSVLKANIGDLNRIKKFVKILAFVSSDNIFFDQPMVANGGSQLLVDIFGEEVGCAARSAIGTNALPGNIPVEIEVLVELVE